MSVRTDQSVQTPCDNLLRELSGQRAVFKNPGTYFEGWPAGINPALEATRKAIDRQLEQ